MKRIRRIMVISFVIVSNVIFWQGVTVSGATGSGRARQGPIPPISSGFGAWGPHTPATPESFQMDSQGYTNTVTLYYPDDQTNPAPTIFFAVGWNISCQDYEELFRFLASKGYVVVCDDYGEDSGVIGDQLKDCFTEAVNRYPDRIDTGRIGLCGHSSGAGLLPSLAYDFVRNKGWGGSGGEHLFIFSSAPWFDFDMTDAILADYPAGIKMIVQTYEDDETTDLRTYIDQFESIPVPDTEKDYIILRPATVSGYDYLADHSVIATGGGGYGVYDAMDDYGVFRLMDALAAYTFTGGAAAKDVALGDGSDAQIGMGELPDLISTDDPRPIPGAVYDYPCDVSDNPRRDHCDDYDDELPPCVLVSPIKNAVVPDEHPVFTWEPSPTATTYYLQVRPLLPDGEPDWSVSYGESVTASAACCDGGAENCVFTLTSALPDGEYVWWIRPGNDTTGGAWSRRGYFEKSSGSASLPTMTPFGLMLVASILTLTLIRRRSSGRH